MTRDTWIVAVGSATAWALVIAGGVFATHSCDEQTRREAAYRCSADGLRDDERTWLRECLQGSCRSAVDCEAFAHRQAYERGECRAEASKP